MFQNKYLSYKLTNLGLICRLFALTFTSRNREWFKTFATGSIHPWVHFMKLFISAHQNYECDQLCDEIESLQRDEDKSIDDFDSKILKIYYKFHDDD